MAGIENPSLSTRPIPKLKDLRNAIPSHCFNPSTSSSLFYLSRDLATCVFLGYLALHIPLIDSLTARSAAWTTYGILQGLVCTGLWILGHECGHGAFSKRQWVNDLTGWFLHAGLLVPYFAWRSTHARHHMYTGHMTKDTAYVPYREEEVEEKRHSRWFWWMFEDAPFWVMTLLVARQLFGWPLYFLFYMSAGTDTLQRKEKRRWWRMSHYDPTGLIYRPREAKGVILSDIGILLTLAILYRWAEISGVKQVFLVYGIPYLWVNHWMITITYLQHTHPSIPRYEQGAWTFSQGVLCTMDRDTGFLGRYFFHSVMETHVVHHFFPRIPFYHAHEATEAIVPILGPYYNYDTAPLLTDLWKTFNTCKSVKATDNGPGIVTGTLSWTA